jgi:hypothetical protein
MSYDRDLYYDRRYTLLVGGKEFVIGGAGRQIRINFTISMSFHGYQSTGDIAIYNLNSSTVDDNIKPGSVVALSAGYVGSEAGIFAGTVKYVLRERVGPDTITRIMALSNGATETTISQAPGINTKVTDLIQSCATAAGYGLVWTPDDFANETLYTRGYQLEGNPIEILRTLSGIHAFYVLVENNKLVVVKKGKSRDTGTIIKISESTGMEGIPSLTWVGVDVTTRLNPALVIGSKFQIEGNLQTYNMANFYYRHIPKGDGQGVYGIEKIEHEGDNWGDAWSTKLTGYTVSGQ